MSALDLIATSTGVTRSVPMILDGALRADWERALTALDDAAEDDTGSLAMPAVTEALKTLDDLRDKVRASEVIFHFASEGLEWVEYLHLQAEHPPREGHPIDRIRGFNIVTFYPVLVRRTGLSVSTADTEPEPMTEAAWDRLLGKPATDDQPAMNGTLNVKQVNELAEAAFYVMNGETTVPPSARSLLKSQDFGASLAQPSPGTSAPSGSEDGNPPGSSTSSEDQTSSTPGDVSGPGVPSSV